MRRTSEALLLAVALLATACGHGASATPRNVILISIDTVRADHLSCYGHERATSPAIDALAARGVRFARASSAAPWTLPSHTTMFTGLYPSHHGVKDYSNRLPQESVTLAEILAEHGFQTWGVLNTWNIADPRFEIMQGFAPENLRYIKETVKQGKRQLILNTGDQVVEAAEAFLEGRDRARPFFLFAHFYDAHTDFAPDPQYRDAFVAPYGGQLDGTTGQLMAIRERGLHLGPADLRFLNDLYDAEIRELDDRLARFFAYLDEQGLTEDTLIVLVSDHGEEFQDHGGLLHGRTQFEELLHVPLILAGPGVPRGAVVETPVSLVDLLPTILGRFALPAPGPLDGIDLAPSWSGGTLPNRALFAEADHNNEVDGKPVVDVKHMVRQGDAKLHLDRVTGAVELFDLATDPGEQHDLAAKDPARLAELEATLERFQAGAVTGEHSGEKLTGENLELLRGLGYAGDQDGDEEGK